MKLPTKQPIVFLFSGQGSHYYGMGKELMDHDPTFTYWMLRGDTVLAELGHPGFLQTLYQTPLTESWEDLHLTHPGLVIVQFAVCQMLNTLGIQPDAVLGSSLGELAAAVATEVLSFEVGVRLAYHQAKLIMAHCPEGRMLAVLGSPDRCYMESAQLQGLVSLAGVNFESHFIVSGLTDQVMQAKAIWDRLGVVTQLLPVKYAFHHDAIHAAKEPWLAHCARLGLNFLMPKQPWVCLHDSGREPCFSPDSPAENTSFVSIAKQPWTALDCWHAISQPMHFQATIQALEKNHGDTGLFYIDLGPAGMLSNFIHYHLKTGSPSRNLKILSPFQQGRSHLCKLKQELCIQ